MELSTMLKILFKKRCYRSHRAVDRFLLAVMARGKAIWYPHCFDIIHLELDGRKFNLYFDPSTPWNGCCRCKQVKEEDDVYGSMRNKLIWDWMCPSRRVLLRFCLWLESQGCDKFRSAKTKLAAEIERVLSTTAEDDD